MNTKRGQLAVVFALALVPTATGCRAARADPRPGPIADPASPYALVLGSAQDGGLPQIGCERSCCAQTRRDPRSRRFASSLVVVDPAAGRRFLFDASPDLPEQVALARRLGALPAGGAGPAAGPGAESGGEGAGRPPLFDAILLTHAHMGHYIGLAQLGREAYAARGQRLLASASMGTFLRENAPWSDLVASGAVVLAEPLRPGSRSSSRAA